MPFDYEESEPHHTLDERRKIVLSAVHASRLGQSPTYSLSRTNVTNATAKEKIMIEMSLSHHTFPSAIVIRKERVITNRMRAA